jgi:hypothetical protein
MFTQEFMKKYDYKIFLTSDNLRLEKVFKYFGKDKIANFHLMDSEYYYKPIEQKIPAIGHFMQKYLYEREWKGHQVYPNSICQHHKILDCYNLLRNDQDNKFDFICRIRFDTVLKFDLCKVLDSMGPKQLLATSWDYFSIGRPVIMDRYCTGLEDRYGLYPFPMDVGIPNICKQYNDLEPLRWTYAPEIQLFSILFEYCQKNDLDINESLVDIGEDLCVIVR